MAIFGSGDRASAPERADELGEMVLDNHAGEQRRVGDYWEDGPAVLVFLRHYG